MCELNLLPSHLGTSRDCTYIVPTNNNTIQPTPLHLCAARPLLPQHGNGNAWWCCDMMVFFWVDCCDSEERGVSRTPERVFVWICDRFELEKGHETWYWKIFLCHIYFSRFLSIMLDLDNYARLCPLSTVCDHLCPVLPDYDRFRSISLDWRFTFLPQVRAIAWVFRRSQKKRMVLIR